MNHWLGQQILAAGDGNGGWTEILFFLVVVVFYAVGGIIKAATKAASKKQDEQVPRKPARKPAAGGADARPKHKQWHPERPKPKPAPVSQPRPAAAKPQVRPPSRKVVRSQPAARRKQPVKTKKTIKFSAFEPQPEFGKASELTATEIPQTEYLLEILSDYEDPEKLRRAILHYEILGKPVSLRERERGF